MAKNKGGNGNAGDMKASSSASNMTEMTNTQSKAGNKKGASNKSKGAGSSK